jgi:hypothetical protein
VHAGSPLVVIVFANYRALLNRDLPFTRALLLNKNGVNRKLVVETERPVRAVVSIQEPQESMRIRLYADPRNHFNPILLYIYINRGLGESIINRAAIF